MSPRSRHLALRAVGAVLMIYALTWALAPFPAVDYPARVLLDVLDWPIDRSGEALDRNTRWLSSIGAGLLGMVAVLLGSVVGPAAERGDVKTCRTTVVAILVWYTIDNLGSIAAGVPSNAVFNTLYVVPMLVPLLGVREPTQ